MQDLRDKLLKAGLVDKKQARKARTDSRRDRKKKGGGRAELQRQQEQQERYEAKQADQRERDRKRQAELNREQGEREQESRIRDFIRAHALAFNPRRPAVSKRQEKAEADRPFYFMGRDRRIRRVHTSYELAYQLSQGRVAIVEADHDRSRDFAFVDGAAALRLEELDPCRILFWNKATTGPPSELPTYGSGDADPKAR